MTDPLLVKCACGLNYTLEQFRTLELGGAHLFEDSKGPPLIELRFCVCGFTHGMWTDMDGNPVEDGSELRFCVCGFTHGMWTDMDGNPVEDGGG